MGFQIQDGTGTSRMAEIDIENRLATSTVSEDTIIHAVRGGRAFNIVTEFLPITTATENALLYLKNNETEPLIVAAWFIGTGQSGGAASDSLLRVYTNPTGGTIISTANPITPVNRLVGSSTILSADIYKGGEGFTFTGQDPTPVLYQLQGNGSRAFGNVYLGLEKGSSLVVTYEAAGAQPIDIYTGFQVYKTQAGTIS